MRTLSSSSSPPLGYPCSAEVIALRLSDERQYTSASQRLSTPSSKVFQFFLLTLFGVALSLALWPGDKKEYIRLSYSLSRGSQKYFSAFFAWLVSRWRCGPATESSMTSRFRFVKGYRKNLLDCFRRPRSRQALLSATKNSMTRPQPGVKRPSNLEAPYCLLISLAFGAVCPACRH